MGVRIQPPPPPRRVWDLGIGATRTWSHVCSPRSTMPPCFGCPLFGRMAVAVNRSGRPPCRERNANGWTPARISPAVPEAATSSTNHPDKRQGWRGASAFEAQSGLRHTPLAAKLDRRPPLAARPDRRRPDDRPTAARIAARRPPLVALRPPTVRRLRAAQEAPVRRAFRHRQSPDRRATNRRHPPAARRPIMRLRRHCVPRRHGQRPRTKDLRTKGQ